MMMNDSCYLDDDMGMSMGGMMMYFHFGTCEKLLFSSLKITNAGGMIAAVIVSYILAILYEGLKTLREWLLSLDVKQQRIARDKATVNSANGNYESLNETGQKKKYQTISISLGMHAFQSCLHVIQIGYGYILMFIAMSFNGWLFLAVCFGAGTGYFIFGKFRNVFGFDLSANLRENSEHCH